MSSNSSSMECDLGSRTMTTPLSLLTSRFDPSSITPTTRTGLCQQQHHQQMTAAAAAAIVLIVIGIWAMVTYRRSQQYWIKKTIRQQTIQRLKSQEDTLRYKILYAKVERERDLYKRRTNMMQITINELERRIDQLQSHRQSLYDLFDIETTSTTTITMAQQQRPENTMLRSSLAAAPTCPNIYDPSSPLSVVNDHSRRRRRDDTKNVETNHENNDHCCEDHDDDDEDCDSKASMEVLCPSTTASSNNVVKSSSIFDNDNNHQKVTSSTIHHHNNNSNHNHNHPLVPMMTSTSSDNIDDMDDRNAVDSTENGDDDDSSNSSVATDTTTITESAEPASPPSAVKSTIKRLTLVG